MIGIISIHRSGAPSCLISALWTNMSIEQIEEIRSKGPRHGHTNGILCQIWPDIFRRSWPPVEGMYPSNNYTTMTLSGVLHILLRMWSWQGQRRCWSTYKWYLSTSNGGTSEVNHAGINASVWGTTDTFALVLLMSLERYSAWNKSAFLLVSVRAHYLSLVTALAVMMRVKWDGAYVMPWIHYKWPWPWRNLRLRIVRWLLCLPAQLIWPCNSQMWVSTKRFSHRLFC